MARVINHLLFCCRTKHATPESRSTFMERRILPLFSGYRCLAVAALVSALLFVLPLLSRTLAEEAQPTQMYVIGVAENSWLNGRDRPDKKGMVEARFSAGDTVDVYAVSGQWAKVAGGEGGYVWCSVCYLSSTPPDAEPQAYTVRSNGRVRVRETPDGDLVCWLENGDTVQVQIWFEGWAYIGAGYVNKQYLEEALE